MDRRRFLQQLGLLSSATILTSCGSEKGQNRLISYLVPPEDGVLPGEARWLPSTCTECPAGCGLLVRVREGSPVKLEGNPGHPVSGGGLCIRGQASLSRLYHPQRLRTPLRRTAGGRLEALSWEEALGLVSKALEEAKKAGRSSLYLSGRTTGALAEAVERFCSGRGVERLPEFEFFSHAAARKAYGILFGAADVPLYRPERADLMLTLGADLLETFLSPVFFARQFSLSLSLSRPDFRWIHLEPHVSLTGSNAHQRLQLRPGSEPALLLYLLHGLLRQPRVGKRLPASVRAALPPLGLAEAERMTGLPADRLKGLAADLAGAKRPLLVVGGGATAGPQGLYTALLAGLIQWLTGQGDESIDFSRRGNYAGVGSLNDLQQLQRRLDADRVGVLFIARANPLRHLPSPDGFAKSLSLAGLRVGLADLADETTAQMDLVLPLSHTLESWGEAEPRQGVRSLIQPALAPLFDSLSEGEILQRLSAGAAEGSPPHTYRQALLERWQSRYEEGVLNRYLEEGYLEEEPPPLPLRLNGSRAAEALLAMRLPEPLAGPVAILTPSIRTFDGRSSALPLLSEIPDPLTTVSYGPWVSVSTEDAARLGLKDRDEVRLAAGKWSARLPVKVQPGLQAQVLTIQVDAFSEAPWQIDAATGEATLALEKVQMKKTGRQIPLPILAGSTSQRGRGIIPEPVHLKHRQEHPSQSLYPVHDHPDYRWAMAIDLQLCIGCAACVAGCYIENNVPVVGKEDHLKGREMSWLRIEPFYGDDGKVEFLPMLCQHCHNAPCEPVCPVYAAYHNPEGLNIQVYNRCVGTRYCANNCPYKVRRFNWWDHTRKPPLERMVNPDLSVRSRGMMEKCTFCIQRIRAARDLAKDAGRAVGDGEVSTACAQSCPTGAIVFGNLLDAGSRVYGLANSGRVYRVFEGLGTQPSVYYLRPGKGAGG